MWQWHWYRCRLGCPSAASQIYTYSPFSCILLKPLPQGETKSCSTSLEHPALVGQLTASNEGILTCQSLILILLCLIANTSHSQVTLGFNEPYLSNLPASKSLLLFQLCLWDKAGGKQIQLDSRFACKTCACSSGNFRERLLDLPFRKALFY